MGPRNALVATAFIGTIALAACIGGKNRSAGGDAGGAHASAAHDAAALPVVASAQPSRDAEAPMDPAARIARGKELYGRYCDFCHGKDGRGYAADEAPALASDDLLANASDAYLTNAILRGRPGTTMSAWGHARGGPISPADAQNLVAFLRTWQKGPTLAPGTNDAGAPLDAGPAGDPARGAPLYAAHCQSCHGKGGREGKYNMLSNAELLANASDAFLATTIAHGRTGTPMPAFEAKLTKENIGDLVALLRSWQRPADFQLDLPPKAGTVKNAALNPNGPQPAFDPKADFVKVDLVKQELDKKATMVILDARAPGDYAWMHVAGAVSVPFYEAAAYAPEIPKDRFILTYCACPHAASVKLRDALRGLGFTRVAVLDEGINVWRDRGYPVRGGAKP